MTYLESAEGITITFARAMHELEKHGITHETDIAMFLADVGDKDVYTAHEVLHWLGY